ncbi:MAG TPA: hypothetical protein VK335_02815 [Bryobacteraceae bacterium]|nr:hypothetical protein [Bryobacteraceae bacterium]
MSDTIGRITVPTVINSGQTFPLATQYPFGFSVERPVIVHRFGSLDAKQEQRYYIGIGPRKFQFKRPNLNWAEGRQLKAFWESMQGPWKAFTYNVPNPDGTTTGVLVTFEQPPISFEYLRNAAQVGLNLVEVVDPTQAPTYAITSTCLRFPSSALSTALLSEVQQIIPLVHIRVRESAVADIYLSDRRVTVGGQLYLPRLIGIGEPGSDVLISQDIKGTSDNVRFTFGNGDRVMTQVANDTDLKYAEIDLCLFHVNSGILLQLWKGVIQNFTSDGTPIFPVTCSDGFFQIMNQYPERQLSRQCWKTYNDGVNCLGVKRQKRRSSNRRRWRSHELRLLPRIEERMPGARHGSILRRASGRSARRRHQGQLHRLPRLRPQHCNRHFHPFRYDLGPGSAGNLVQ